mmetsp:Transcript_39006/g.74719  ORF Transcript_39006/g.74719 Transcript_39006/m.74719 type:complete len:114 (+) Transcript_39006:235-576(+)|eukprot:CAMPEP_0114226350 /NCGR_PEP_ID=MMETSP0058-20121206/1189_1 /TAXON_ID=36894 /ORGANISM="Pyramimonas parkeae, CCMP726" /LENGTH=113 /DNA_ID=CAMNT_0001337077 /DNA_START=214 /DNA_END=555 /DNA_ORIENTATION=+
MKFKNFFKGKQKGANASGDDSDAAESVQAARQQSRHVLSGTEEDSDEGQVRPRQGHERNLIEKVESLQRELDSRISAEKEHQEEKNLLEFKNQLLLDMLVAREMDNEEDKNPA